jgi:hypothetical protein
MPTHAVDVSEIIERHDLLRTQLGNIFEMGSLGTLIGGFVFGYIDRIGRRPAR